MVGRYPFVEPNRCRSHDTGVAQLREILDAGITTFVSLVAELGPQEEVPPDGVGGLLPYKTALEELSAGVSPLLRLHRQEALLRSGGRSSGLEAFHMCARL
jgi:alanine transaminase